MKKKNFVILLLFLCFPGFFQSAAFAQDSFVPEAVNASIIFLTPGHVQNRLFPLDNAFLNNFRTFNTCFFMVVGTGTLTVRVGVASSVGEYANITYGLTGFIGPKLFIGYGSDAETISLNTEVNGFALGILFTGIISELGNPSYPIVMSMVASLI